MTATGGPPAKAAAKQRPLHVDCHDSSEAYVFGSEMRTDPNTAFRSSV